MTPELESQVLAEIRRLAHDELEHQGEILPTHRLQEDLQLDSMAMIVVATELENRFQVKLEEQDAGILSTVGDLVQLVTRRIREAPSA